MRSRFEDYVLDSDRRQLLRDEAEVHLSPKAFQLLQILVESAPRAMSKKELYEALWPDTFVTESNLAGLIRELRNILGGPRGRTNLIRTVHRFGYAFSGETSPTNHVSTAPAPMSHYRLLWNSQEILLREGETVLGRDPDATVRIDDGTVSRHHARIRVEGATVTIEDLDSKNGTRVSSQRVTRQITLADGDQLELGSVTLTFRSVAPAASTISVTHRSKD